MWIAKRLLDHRLAGNAMQAAHAAKAGLASLPDRSRPSTADRIRVTFIGCGPVATLVAEAAQALAELDWIPLGWAFFARGRGRRRLPCLAALVIYQRPEPRGRRRRDGRRTIPRS